VIINDSTTGTTIRYTTDGVTTPTETVGTLYTGSISISTTTTLKAMAYKSGMTDSPVTTGQYTIILPPLAPVFSPGAGTYTSAPTVTITSSGATAIYYTTNGSTPTTSSTLYTGPILISTSLTLEAIGINSAGTSPVTTGQYTVPQSQQVAPPAFSPPAGAYTSAQMVSISTTTTGASIRYTTDGVTMPTETVGTLYSGAVNVSTSLTLNAIAFKAGLSDSTVTSGDYAITTVIVRYSFSTSNNGGVNPAANLVQGSDGNFYGTTSFGGSSNNGTVYKMTPAGVLTTLVSLIDPANINFPDTALIQGRDGNFYGTTEAGAIEGGGSVFKVTPTGTLTTLVSFTNGGDPMGALVQGSDGNFYGTT
jgi:uncharacterized repeat protein (TIGR03803 family)